LDGFTDVPTLLNMNRDAAGTDSRRWADPSRIPCVSRASASGTKRSRWNWSRRVRLATGMATEIHSLFPCLPRTRRSNRSHGGIHTRAGGTPELSYYGILGPAPPADLEGPPGPLAGGACRALNDGRLAPVVCHRRPRPHRRRATGSESPASRGQFHLVGGPPSPGAQRSR
jgi:hypothetical protein